MQGAPFVMREAGYLRGFVVHSSRDMRVSRMGPWMGRDISKPSWVKPKWR